MSKPYSLEELRQKSSRGDVTFDLYRLYGEQLKKGDPEIIGILEQGHVSEAANWLVSTTPDQMKFGTASREERLAKAQGHAALSGIPLVVIAEQHGLSHLVE